MLNFNISKVAYLRQPSSLKIICAKVTWNNKITACPKEINPICDIRKHRGENTADHRSAGKRETKSQGTSFLALINFQISSSVLRGRSIF